MRRADSTVRATHHAHRHALQRSGPLRYRDRNACLHALAAGQRPAAVRDCSHLLLRDPGRRRKHDRQRSRQQEATTASLLALNRRKAIAATVILRVATLRLNFSRLDFATRRFRRRQDAL